MTDFVHCVTFCHIVNMLDEALLDVSLLYSVLEYSNFLNSDISQGSVATYVRCDELFTADFILNLLASLSVREL